ncbi:MAG: FxDxF family PEP-CTERM protein [Aquincola tertiaricarbonis]
MKRSAIVIASVLALAGASAHAVDYTWNTSTPLNLPQYYALQGMTFTDTISFSLTGVSDVEVGAVANIFGSFGISGGSLTFYKGNTVLDSFALTGATDFIAAPSLGVGDYSFVVSGTVSGKSGGSYLLNAAVTPVPEPETYALMLAGLGAVAFIARRRKSA